MFLCLQARLGRNTVAVVVVVVEEEGRRGVKESAAEQR